MNNALLLLFFLFSCTHLKEKEQLIQRWIGRSVEEITHHPYFSSMKMKSVVKKDGSEIRTYSFGRPVTTKARSGIPDYWCENIFTLKEGKVVGYEQYGPCPYTKEALPPRLSR